jgi:hypothetical protein
LHHFSGGANDRLNIQRQHEGETAARDVDPAYDRYGSSTTDAVKAARSSMSALARKRTLPQGICLDRVPRAAATAASITLSARLSKFIGTATQHLAAGAKERELASDL